jgi:hypothetical protein
MAIPDHGRSARSLPSTPALQGNSVPVCMSGGREDYARIDRCTLRYRAGSEK